MGSNHSHKSYLQPLFKMQKKIVRLVANKPPQAHTSPLMQKLHILNIYNLYTLRVCAEMHPFIHPKKELNRPDHNHHYQLTSDIHNYPTRYSLDDHLFIPNTTQHSKTGTPTRTTSCGWASGPTA